ncbi:hypothetical protein KY337_01800 [Candidatus Woesearchaeota archaeon]|nr:hypothetical protein [Candidatus Woesearchaeota archaeon]
MLEIVYSPQWFYGIDILFEFIIVIASFMVAFFSYKIYKFTKEPRCFYFGLSFLAISLAFISKILTNFQIYFNILTRNKVISNAIITIRSHDTFSFFVSGYFFHRVLILIALAGIVIILYRYDRKILILFAYLVAIIAAFSTSEYFIFHVTTSILLAYIFYHYFQNYKNNPTTNTFLVSFAFFLILISQIIFINIILGAESYVIAQVIQGAGYITLLTAYIKIKNGKKKDKAGHNKRHACVHA